MVNKYVKALEARELNTRTGETWAIQDVPATWRKKVEKQVLSDGYEILDDGTVSKVEETEEAE